MQTQRIRRGRQCRIPLEADEVKKANIGTNSIKDKYVKEANCFRLDYEDTENLTDSDLRIDYEKDGRKETKTIHLEMI